MTIGSPIYTDRQYARMLLKLFPQGDAFPRIESNTFFDFLLGLAQELARIDARINTLVAESTPEAADELIEEHETDLGLPDGFTFPIPANLAERQARARDMEIFPGFLATGWTDTGTLTAGSAIVSGLSDTSDIFVGDAVSFAAGWDNAKIIIIDKTDTTLTLEQNAPASGTTVLTGYFDKAEQSERFYNAIAGYMGCVINSFTYYGMFLMGVGVMGDEIGDYMRFTVTINYSLVAATTGEQFEAYLDYLKPAGWIFLFV
jgi:uncharacterized protein YmfQ (DUF2313 family)